MKLYGYWRSGATYRVRIAFALKEIGYDYEPVNLLKGEQTAPDFLKISPQGLIPALVTKSGAVLTQSLAIIEWLDETYPAPALFPDDPVERAKARQIAYALACEAQPFQNLRTQKYLREEAGLDETAVKAWLDRFVLGAMRAVDAMMAETAGDFCVGDAPSLADICLVPQVYAALRFGLELSGLDRLNEVYKRCLAHEAFIAAHPDAQPDAVKG